MGSGGNTTSTVTQQNIPKEFFPYFDRLLLQAENEMGKPYQAYEGERLTGTSGDTTASYDLVRDIATRSMPGSATAASDASANMYRTSELLDDVSPYTFSQYGGFDAGAGTAYDGFSATDVDPYSKFSATIGSAFDGFRAGEATGYGGFSQSKGTAFDGFEAGQADPYAKFKETSAEPYSDFSQAGFSGYEFGPAEVMSSETAQEYMDPYLRAVVDIEKEKAKEDYDIARASRSSQAVGAGAFGGSRAQIAESMAERDYMNRLRDIEATGLKSAFGEATRRFEADRAAKTDIEKAKASELGRVQTGTASETGRVQTSSAEEAARVQRVQQEEAARVQQAEAAELARTQGISIDEASRIQAAKAAEEARVQKIDQEEAARVQAASAAELARTQGISIEEAARVQAAQAAEAARIQNMSKEEFARVQESQAAELARTQGITVAEAARIQAANAAEIARVQGISIDEAARVQAAQASELARVQAGQSAEDRAAIQDQLALMGFSSEQATLIADLEQQARTGDIQAAQLLETIGKAQEGKDQAKLDLQYEDYLRQQGYNKEQIGFMSSILQGLPLRDAGTITEQTPYNPIQQALGAGLAGLSLYKGFQ
jgi:hypothetical protein